MYRNWEDDAAIEVAGARIGSVVSFVESSQASQGQSRVFPDQANCHQPGSQQPAPDLVSSESPGVISQHFQVFSLQYAQMVIF